MLRLAVLLLLLLLSALPPGEAAPLLQLSDAIIDQGRALRVTVRGTLPDGTEVRFAGRRWPLYGAGGLHLTYVAADARTAAGAYALSVVAQDRVLARRTVRVRWVAWRQRRLSLDPDKAALFTPEMVAEEQRKVAAALQVLEPRQRWEGAFLLPVDAPVSSPYGVQSVYNGTVRGFHRGTDFAAPEGTPVRAANHGIVRLAEPLPLSGDAVFVDHGLGVLTGYFHMSRILVTPGQRVRRGDLVGRVGSTGVTTGAHLHWALRINGLYVDPLPWSAEGAP
ncbi:MAG: M23 family metallopeptidase [Armatimonadota bacterium]|nr:M23 family metallopeptidase [Armatimonadota bacterium]MDR7452613.1 M23 family metallopeptidase [Armatimonadota bacterium]MDR7467818.1 M23 family metallopeptidase [Armatimonadota bacterium]MDR7494596.1 M23 family metallopeptidase [Armatimonadota bacterium]MDR7499656.1 M23 family metallopeptidase [Armatimonadota bacterium]